MSMQPGSNDFLLFFCVLYLLCKVTCDFTLSPVQYCKVEILLVLWKLNTFSHSADDTQSVRWTRRKEPMIFTSERYTHEKGGTFIVP